MSNHAEGIAIVLGPEDGDSYWQPLPSRGYVINKINPYTSPYDEFSVGVQVLEPGAHVRRHAHERSHELLFCFRGTGSAEIVRPIGPEKLALRGQTPVAGKQEGSSS